MRGERKGGTRARVKVGTARLTVLRGTPQGGKRTRLFGKIGLLKRKHLGVCNEEGDIPQNYSVPSIRN